MSRQMQRRIMMQLIFKRISKQYDGEPRKNRRLMARRGMHLDWQTGIRLENMT
jgi:hypothetical protein